MIKINNGFLKISYRLPLNCRNDDYLWGFYIASRPSCHKSYRVYVTRNEADKIVDMIEYSFPKWWAKKIEEHLIER